MLDERTSMLLSIINKICSSGSYCVVTTDELILKFPSEYGADKDLIVQMITNLSQKGYISVRYDRDGELCLAPTPKGRLYFENDSGEVYSVKKTSKIDLLPYFCNFVSIFTAIVSAFLILKLLGGIC